MKVAVIVEDPGRGVAALRAAMLGEAVMKK